MKKQGVRKRTALSKGSIGADESSDAFDRIVQQMARPKPADKTK
jgi:hypothetical protein